MSIGTSVDRLIGVTDQKDEIQTTTDIDETSREVLCILVACAIDDSTKHWADL